MPERSFHHGNLRAVLLERAEAMLRTGGSEALSLRELARQAGVSHGAPRSHFIDRQALLDALAVRGFDRLAEGVRSVLRGEGSAEERFRAVARRYVAFAVDDAALMELMFATKVGGVSEQVGGAAGRLFAVLDEALDESVVSGDDDRERFKLLFAATMQGTATLIAAQRVTRAQGDRLTEDAIDQLLTSKLAARALPRIAPSNPISAPTNPVR